jgi:SAM-dependent methyltransferase
MKNARKFLLETSITPIYQRIVDNFWKNLTDYGQEVALVNPKEFSSDFDYIKFIDNNNFDYCIVTNSSAALSAYSLNFNKYLFQEIKTPIIFIHHDNPFSIYKDSEEIQNRILAYQDIKSRSIHFCIEYLNFIDFKCLEIENVFPIFHASEFKSNIVCQPDKEILDVSFVGHVLPGNDDLLNKLNFSHYLKLDYWQRVSSLDTLLEPSSVKFAEKECTYNDSWLDFYTLKFFYRAMLHKLSQPFRGEVICRIKDKFNVAVFGGDPAYLHKMNRQLIIDQQNINYYPATQSYLDAQKIYKNSKINLNITSLQFDTAVINRVIDVGTCGGFVLTDWKSDLSKMTSVSEEISYKTIDELNQKIDYYLSHERERLEIAAQLSEDVRKNCSYSQTVDYILSCLDTMTSDHHEPLKVDLGCGPRKADGFIGVDVSLVPGVDIVADLNRRFPFADSSVDCVRAHDTVEHLHDRIHTMNEIWRICKPGAVVDIRVPSTDGRGAFQDPTHVSFWNVNSFQYYCAEFPAYLSLCQQYGFKGQFSLTSLEEFATEGEVVHVHAQLVTIKDGPPHTAINALQNSSQSIAVFLDWRQPEESLAHKIESLFIALIKDIDSEPIYLLFHLDTDISAEDAHLFISGVLMNFFLAENNSIDPEQFHIDFLQNISEHEWKALEPRLIGRIMLDEVNELKALNDIPCLSLNHLS